MSTVSKVIADATARTAAFDLLKIGDIDGFKKISNQSFGVSVVDDNGDVRMVEVKAIVRKIDEELSGDELLDFEAEEYQHTITEKAEKKKEAERKKAEKIAKDKKKREEKKG